MRNMDDDNEPTHPEVDEDRPEEVVDAFARISALLRGYDDDTTEWAQELREELNDLTKQNLINRINVHDADSEFLGLLSSIDQVPDRSEEFNYRQELLNPYKLDNELLSLLSHVESAKTQSSKRMEKLHVGFERVQHAQKTVVDKIIKQVRQEAGLPKLEEREGELKDQVAKLQQTLKEKKETIQRNNREKQLSAEELRKKYEQETEDRVRNVVTTIEQKTKQLATLTAANEKLKGSQSTVQNDLGKLLQELGQEEKAAAAEAGAAMNPLHRFRASVYRHANVKGASTNLFADMSSGTITKELVGDSNRALEEAFAKQQELFQQITEKEQSILSQRKELTALLQGEEHKALERLKKVCDNLQVKIQSDDQRVKVMAALVNQMQRGEVEAAAQRTTVRKTVMAMAASKDKPSTLGNVRARARKTPTTPKGDDALDLLEDLLPLVRGGSDSTRETISMQLHRRLYAQYYTMAHAAARSEEASSGTVLDRSGVSMTGPDKDKGAKAQDLPRKRRITAAQSTKIQKIVDMINLQHAKLSSVRDDEIQHILDYREFAAEAERPESTLSNYSFTSAKSSKAVSVKGAPSDHTRLLPGADGPVEAEGVTAAAHKDGQKSPKGSRAAADAHLRIPTTADLEDQNDAEFYAQNYGVKLALEHLNAFMEVLTSGRSSLGPSGHGSLAATDADELQTVEGLRNNIQRLISLIREMHMLSQNNKAVRKTLQSEVDAKLRECDQLRSELLQEIEGSHWPITMKAGQYEVEVEQRSQRVRELKKIVKQWDQRVSLKRAQNIRISTAVSAASTRKVSAAATKLSAVEEFNRRRRNKTPAGAAAALAPTLPPTALDIANKQIEERYSVAGKRMTVFDDISSIYDAAMSNIRRADPAIPHRGDASDTKGASAGGGRVTGSSSMVSSVVEEGSSALQEDQASTQPAYEGPSVGSADREEDQQSGGWEDLEA
jgi:myosin heavy subunit